MKLREEISTLREELSHREEEFKMLKSGRKQGEMC